MYTHLSWKHCVRSACQAIVIDASVQLCDGKYERRECVRVTDWKGWLTPARRVSTTCDVVLLVQPGLAKYSIYTFKIV